MHVVFDAHAALPREVDARLDRHHGVQRQRFRVGRRHARRFVHFQTEAVPQGMPERLAESPRGNRLPAQRVGIPARLSRPDVARRTRR